MKEGHAHGTFVALADGQLAIAKPAVFTRGTIVSYVRVRSRDALDGASLRGKGELPALSAVIRPLCYEILQGYKVGAPHGGSGPAPAQELAPRPVRTVGVPIKVPRRKRTRGRLEAEVELPRRAMAIIRDVERHRNSTADQGWIDAAGRCIIDELCVLQGERILAGRSSGLETDLERENGSPVAGLDGLRVPPVLGKTDEAILELGTQAANAG
jgi:hypothetical protein